jgi:hypothetical protein
MRQSPSEFFFQYKVWVKPTAEQQFLYGHNVMKSGLARITENTARYQGVVIYSMSDIPLVSNRPYRRDQLSIFPRFLTRVSRFILSSSGLRRRSQDDRGMQERRPDVYRLLSSVRHWRVLAERGGITLTYVRQLLHLG